MSSPPRSTELEIVVHVVADVLALCLLGDFLRRSVFGDAEVSEGLVVAAVALLVWTLSGVTLAHRSRPASRTLRRLWLGLSILVAVLGSLAAAALLAFVVSGSRYRGPSPDAGAMAMLSGFFLFYPAAGLLMLPLGLNASRIPDRLRGRAGCCCALLAALPILLLIGLRLFGPDPPPQPDDEEESKGSSRNRGSTQVPLIR